VSKAAGSADSSGLDSLFNTWDKFAGEGPDIKDLAGAVKEITNPHIPAGVQDTLDSLFSWTGSAKNDLGQVRDRFKGLGDEMGNLAKNGAGETAAKTFNALTEEFKKNGKGAQEAGAPRLRHGQGAGVDGGCCHGHGSLYNEGW
jgi:hypothetical protein